MFHLIRRSTRQRKEFSSLMFLNPTPPRVTRKSRLEDLWLLLLRCLVIAALAFGFSRPFFRGNTATTGPTKRVVLLIDNSASTGQTPPQRAAAAISTAGVRLAITYHSMRFPLRPRANRLGPRILPAAGAAHNANTRAIVAF